METEKEVGIVKYIDRSDRLLVMMIVLCKRGKAIVLDEGLNDYEKGEIIFFDKEVLYPFDYKVNKANLELVSKLFSYEPLPIYLAKNIIKGTEYYKEITDFVTKSEETLNSLCKKVGLSELFESRYSYSKISEFEPRPCLTTIVNHNYCQTKSFIYTRPYRILLSNLSDYIDSFDFDKFMNSYTVKYHKGLICKPRGDDYGTVRIRVIYDEKILCRYDLYMNDLLPNVEEIIYYEYGINSASDYYRKDFSQYELKANRLNQICKELLYQRYSKTNHKAELASSLNKKIKEINRLILNKTLTATYEWIAEKLSNYPLYNYKYLNPDNKF